MESWVYEQGVENRIERGTRKEPRRVFEGRLGRPLAEHEHATLRQRLDVLGAGWLEEVVLNLSADALAMWLNDPDAS